MYNFRFNIIFILALLICQSVFSQKQHYQATIVDSSNEEPVAFSTVSWGEDKGTISDITGFVRFNIQKEELDDTITISCIGYDSKRIPISSLSEKEMNHIFLNPGILEMKKVIVEGKRKRVRGSEEIIEKAISSIPKNYPQDTVIYHGYYREYTKQSEKYINVFESIIDLQDPGFDSQDHFMAEMLYKRLNRDFKTDGLLIKPYDNFKKYVPYALMPIQYNNELLILRAHDPVRNYNRFSFDFIKTLEDNFIENHLFEKPKLTYLKGEPFYYIQFRENPWTVRSENRIFGVKGYLYISAQDYGIKKINYQLFLETFVDKQKYFELNLEYKDSQDKYYLNYISFNNLFRIRDYTLLRKEYNASQNTLNLHFNKKITEKMFEDLKFNIYWQGKPLNIQDKRLHQSRIILKLNNRPISSEEELFVNMNCVQEYSENSDSSKAVHTYYQYREFFIRDIYSNKRLNGNLMDKRKPVMQNPATAQRDIDTSWLNTPLIAEKTYVNKLTEENRYLLQGLEALTKLNAKKKKELLYIHTDRDVYFSGDTLWFKAYVRSKATLRKSTLSRDLFVYLFNDEGKVVHEAKFIISDSGVQGQLALDYDLEKGNYYVVAYSSWMKNFGVEEVFRKKIEIKSARNISYNVVPLYDKKNYYPGDTVNIRIKCYNNLSHEVKYAGFVYKITGNNKIITQGKASRENDHISFVLPQKIDGSCRVELQGVHEGIRMEKNYKIPVHYNVHVDFFPEGGQALNGVMSKMAFKATYSNGNPAQIKGKIMDEKGKVIHNIASQHKGMGMFSFIPKKDRNFYLKLTSPPKTKERYQLPKANDRGWLLNARNNQDKIYVDIKNGDSKKNICMIILMSRGHLFYSKVVPIKQSESLIITTDTLPSGIGVITLLDRYMLPKAERLVFVNYHKRNQVEITTNRKKYAPREKVKLNINITDTDNKPGLGDYSLAVVDEKLGLSETIIQPNILSMGYFSHEIRGKISNPGYYFQTGNRQEQYHLDLLLMTQGWRNYSYREQVKQVDSLPDPVNQDAISGKILKKRSVFDPKPTKGKVNVYFGGTSHIIETDEKGNFTFRPVFDGVNPNILLSASDEQDKENVVIQLNSDLYRNRLESYLTHLIDSMAQKPTSTIYTYEKTEKLYEWQGLNQFWISPVTVTAKKYRMPLPGSYDLEKATISDIRNTSSVYDILSNLDVPFKFGVAGRDPVTQCYFNGKWNTISWNVDGSSWRDGAGLNTEAIIKFQIIKKPHSFKSGGSVRIIIKTDSTKIKYNTLAWRAANSKALKRYHISKEFYKPVYNTQDKKANPRLDLRKTIHWEPDVQLDSTGKTTVTFYNADHYTNIKCILQGISQDGIPAYGETGYEVSFIK